MRTELDQRMDAMMAALTGEGGQLALGQVERFGRTLPYIAAAPPTLTGYFAHFCAQHRDTEFLVAGDERLTFGQVYDAATRVAHALVDGYAVTKGQRIGIAARNSPVDGLRLASSEREFPSASKASAEARSPAAPPPIPSATANTACSPGN